MLCRMGRALQFVLVLLFLAGANCVAAGTIWVLGKLANLTPFGEEPLAWIPIGFVGVAAGVGFLWGVIWFIGRPRRNPGRALG